MDYQFLILSITIIVLQLITLSMVESIKKQNKGGRGEINRRPGAAGGENRGDRVPAGPPRRGNIGDKKAGDSRTGRPLQPRPQLPRQQGQAQSPAPAIDSMETLRDINLRLKNAEREQENARKKIMEGGNGGSSIGRDGGRPPRGERIDRGDRGDRSGRSDKSGRRDFNRDRYGEGRPDRPRRSETDSSGYSPTPVESTPGSFEPQTPPPPPDMAVIDIGNSDDLQHGRRFTAKRRQLPSDAQPDADADVAPDMEAAAQPQVNESAAPETPNTPDVENQPESAEPDNIQYGR